MSLASRFAQAASERPLIHLQGSRYLLFARVTDTGILEMRVKLNDYEGSAFLDADEALRLGEFLLSTFREGNPK